VKTTSKKIRKIVQASFVSAHLLFCKKKGISFETKAIGVFLKKGLASLL